MSVKDKREQIISFIKLCITLPSSDIPVPIPCVLCQAEPELWQQLIQHHLLNAPFPKPFLYDPLQLSETNRPADTSNFQKRSTLNPKRQISPVLITHDRKNYG